MDLNDYLELAIKKQELESYAALGRALGLKSNVSVVHMRQGKQLPSDDTMIRLAELAGEDPQVGLLRLNVWRSKSDKARNHYQALAAKVAQTASCLTVAVISALFLIKTDAHARTDQEQMCSIINTGINCATIRYPAEDRPTDIPPPVWRRICKDLNVVHSRGLKEGVKGMA